MNYTDEQNASDDFDAHIDHDEPVDGCTHCEGEAEQEASELAMTVEADAPTPCAWCEQQAGIRTEGSHGICAAHIAEVLSVYHEKRRAGQVAL